MRGGAGKAAWKKEGGVYILQTAIASSDEAGQVGEQLDSKKVLNGVGRESTFASNSGNWDNSCRCLLHVAPF